MDGKLQGKPDRGLEEPGDVQNIFSKAPLPFSLVEEVIEVAAKGDENKAKSQKSKYTCREQTEETQLFTNKRQM